MIDYCYGSECDVLLATTGVSGEVWTVLAYVAIAVGAAGLVASQRMMAKGRRLRREARARRQIQN